MSLKRTIDAFPRGSSSEKQTINHEIIETNSNHDNFIDDAPRKKLKKLTIRRLNGNALVVGTTLLAVVRDVKALQAKVSVTVIFIFSYHTDLLLILTFQKYLPFFQKPFKIA
jgi:hypothetical protein